MALITVSILTALLTLGYVSIVFFFLRGWNKLPYYKAPGRAPGTAVSILIAARNEEEKIKDTITDLLAQDYPKALTEIIIVDDHSTDGTAGLIRSYANQTHAVAAIIATS